MKKVLVLFLMAMMMFSVNAEEFIDVSQYSLEELLMIRETIDREIGNRTTSPIEIIQPGKYIAGTDIPSGSYVIVGLTDESPSGSSAHILWAESNERAKVVDYIGSVYITTSERIQVNLTEGMLLEIRYCECAIQETEPLNF